jgi:hypothetical protein
MRLVFLALVALTTSICSCRRSSMEGVSFLSHPDWPSRELLNVEESTYLFLRSSTWDFCATWTNTPECRVFVSCGHWERWGDETWTVLVLGPGSQVLDYNATNVKADSIPRRLLSISPLRFGFGSANTERVRETVAVLHPADGWRARLTQQEKLDREVRAMRENRKLMLRMP